MKFEPFMTETLSFLLLALCWTIDIGKKHLGPLDPKSQKVEVEIPLFITKFLRLPHFRSQFSFGKNHSCPFDLFHGLDVHHPFFPRPILDHIFHIKLISKLAPKDFYPF